MTKNRWFQGALLAALLVPGVAFAAAKVQGATCPLGCCPIARAAETKAALEAPRPVAAAVAARTADCPCCAR